MSYKSLVLKSALSMSLALSFSTGLLPAKAQQEQGQPQVSVVHLQVQPGSNGQQMVLTPRGYLVPLPGRGVNGGVADIYMGNNGGFWYVDKDGQTEDLTNYVAKLRAQAGQLQQASPPQYSPAQTTNNYYNNTNSNNTTSGGSGSGTGTAVATAAAAGLGAMAGAAMTNGYYNNVPYGTPMYYGARGPYYNNGNGSNVFVNQDGDVNWNNVAAANNMQNYHQQQQLNQAAAYQNANQQQREQAVSSNQQARQSAYGNSQGQQESAQRFQQQQQWYNNQLSSNKTQAAAWQQSAGGENPFVRQGSGRFGQGQQDGAAAGRFGQAQQDGAAGGRFGQSEGGAEGGRFKQAGEGGRFGGGEGGRFGGGEGGGGRLGQMEQNAGGRLGGRGRRGR